MITSCLDAYISRYGDFCANDNNDNDDTTNYCTPCACVWGDYYTEMRGEREREREGEREGERERERGEGGREGGRGERGPPLPLLACAASGSGCGGGIGSPEASGGGAPWAVGGGAPEEAGWAFLLEEPVADEVPADATALGGSY